MEVILAVAIAAAMLGVVLFFYHQASNLRDQVLAESDRIATIRMLLERMTGELRTARGGDSFLPALTGNSSSLQFLSTGLVPTGAWMTVSGETTQAVRASGLRRIQYRLQGATNLVAGTGLERMEEPWPNPQPVTNTVRDLSITSEIETEPVSDSALVSDQLRYLRFRYWNGIGWIEEWTGDRLPPGIEVAIGIEPLPEDLTPDEYPYELFRRVVFLPGATQPTGLESPGTANSNAAPVREEEEAAL